MFLVAENGWRCPRRMDGTSRCTRCTMQDTRRCAGVTEPAFNRRDFKEAYSGKESDPVQPCRKNIIFVSPRIACTRRPDRRYGNIAFTDGHFSAWRYSIFKNVYVPELFCQCLTDTSVLRCPCLTDISVCIHTYSIHICLSRICGMGDYHEGSEPADNNNKALRRKGV